MATMADYLVQHNGFMCAATTVGTTKVLAAGPDTAPISLVTALPAIATGEALEYIQTGANLANDVAGGTGVRGITCVFMKTDGTIDQQTFALAGNNTPVAFTNTTIARIIDVFATSHGTLHGAAGNIVIRTVAGGNVRCAIAIGDLRAAPGRTTIPAGIRARYRGFRANNTGPAGTPVLVRYFIEADFNQYTGALSENNYTMIDQGCTTLASGQVGDGPMADTAGRQIEIPSLCTVRMTVIADAASIKAVCGFVYIEKFAQ